MLQLTAIGNMPMTQTSLNSYQARLEAIIEGTRAGTWEWQVQTGELRVNARWAEIIGYTLEELPPISILIWQELTHPDDRGHSDALLAKHFAGEIPFYECMVRMRHKSGKWIWIQDRGMLVTRDADGQPEWVAGTHIDVTHRYGAEIILSKLAKTIPGVIYTFQIDTEGQFSFPYVSEKAREFYGVEAEQIQNDADIVFDAIHPDDIAGLMASIELSHQTMDHWTYEYRVVQNGRSRWLQGNAIPEREADGTVVWYGMINDIDRLKQLEMRLRELSSTDELTGLYNRRHLITHLQSSLDQLQRHQSQPISVVLIDLDKFKEINDTYGHQTGDDVLVAFAELLKARMRKTDIYGRFGGEEFILILPGSDEGEALRIARELLWRLREITFNADDNPGFQVSFSAGVSELNTNDNSPSDVLSRADKAMYAAKTAGRRQVFTESSVA